MPQIVHIRRVPEKDPKMKVLREVLSCAIITRRVCFFVGSSPPLFGCIFGVSLAAR